MKNFQQLLKQYQNNRKLINFFQGYSQLFALLFGGFMVYLILTMKAKYYKVILDDQKKYVLKDYEKNQYKDQNKNYVTGSYIEKQLEEIINNTENNKIKIVIGTQGSGKTSAINFLVQQLRSNGQKVYHIDLNKQTYQARRKLKFFFKALQQQCQKNNITKDKQVKLVIDCMQNLQYMYNQQQPRDKQTQKFILHQILNFSKDNKVNVTCVMSKSKYFRKLQKMQQIGQQNTRFLILQDMTSQQYKKQADQILTTHSPQISQSIKSYLIQQQYPISQLLDTIKTLKQNQNQSQQKTLKKLKRNEQLRQSKGYFAAVDVFNIIKNKKIARRFLENVVKSGEQLYDENNCENIVYNILKQTKSPIAPELRQAANIMENESTRNYLYPEGPIMFCRPKFKIYKKGMQKFLNKEKSKLY